MNTKKGFTLVELLVVIAILAILATVSVVGYTSFIDRANVSNLETEAHQIEELIDAALLVPGETVVVPDGEGTVVLEVVNGKWAESDVAVDKADTNLCNDINALEGELAWDEDGLTFTKYGYVYSFSTGTSAKESN